MNLAVKMTISGILGDFKLGKYVESPYFNQLGILVRSSTENKIMSQNPPPDSGSSVKIYVLALESGGNSIKCIIFKWFFWDEIHRFRRLERFQEGKHDF